LKALNGYLSAMVELAPLLKLSRDERIQLVEELWDSIIQEKDPSPMPEWNIQELLRRKDSFEKNPSSASSWDAVKSRILSRSA
jgi:putative addiction module component (TIGR02574 family)